MPRLGECRDAVAVDLLRCADHAISLLAGPEAERLFTAAPLAGTEHDEEGAAAIASIFCRTTRSVDAFIAFARAEARALLIDHRAAVLALADALLHHRTIYAEQINNVIRSVMASCSAAR
jgi:hypothetical protein